MEDGGTGTVMVENRELGIPDYLAILRRRRRAILIPLLLAPIIGFGISYFFTPRYTSQSLILIEDQTVPAGYVKPVITADVLQRITTMEQQILSRKRLQPMIDRLGLVKNGKTVDDVLKDIRTGFDIEPVAGGGTTSTSSSVLPSTTPSTKKKTTPNTGNTSDIPGFTVSFTGANPRDAQLICSELTSLLLTENINNREQVAQSTTDFLAQQVDDGKKALDDQDAKLAAFKKEYLGQLPSDQDANLKVFTALNSQLDANTQSLNRAQQDKAYSQSLLAQEIASWKASQSSDNPQTIEQQLAKLQSQLIDLQSRYTDDYPDVAKTKRDIAQLQAKLKVINSAPTQAADSGSTNSTEPPEIRQLRVQIHQYEDLIVQATDTQKRLQQQIRQYQSRIALSPAVEEQYKSLTRDYETAQSAYQDLLGKKGQAQIQSDLERNQQGEQMRLLNSAGLPEDPTFPLRWMFALGGLAAGLPAGLSVALLLEFQDKALRDEKDILAALELPTLAVIPWVAADGTDNSGVGFWRKSQVEV
jgi:uncharacterized protein involved in exopolysaccharide biosynthesis